MSNVYSFFSAVWTLCVKFFILSSITIVCVCVLGCVCVCVRVCVCVMFYYGIVCDVDNKTGNKEVVMLDSHSL